MAFIDATVVNIALPTLQSSLHATVIDVEWVVEAYGLFLSALILVGGTLGDSRGRRAMFLLGVIVFGSASAGCGLSSSIRTLVIWRNVQGLAAAFLVPGSLAIISASFDDPVKLTPDRTTALRETEPRTVCGAKVIEWCGLWV
jgi:MFS family permease